MCKTEYVIILMPIPRLFFFNCWVLQPVLPAAAEEKQKTRIMNVEYYIPQNFAAGISSWKRRWSREGEGIVKGKIPMKDIILSLLDSEISSKIFFPLKTKPQSLQKSPSNTLCEEKVVSGHSCVPPALCLIKTGSSS